MSNAKKREEWDARHKKTGLQSADYLQYSSSELRGSNSMAECQLPKLNVGGSIPLSRSTASDYMIAVYVLESARNGKRYVGITKDLERRLDEHRSGRSKGGQILGDFRVLHTEIHPDYAAARAREVFLKSGQGRKWLQEAFPP